MNKESKGRGPAAERQPDTQDQGSRREAPAGNGCRVLIADDEAWQRELLTELLTAEGYLCECVCTAQDAVAALIAGHYDVFVTDINMPDNNSLVFLDEIRTRGIGTPIIVLTGQPTVSTAIEAVHCSIHEYLLKPVAVETLSRSVATAARKGRLQRNLRETRERLEVWVAAIATLEAGLGRVDSKKTEGDEAVASVAAETVMLFNLILRNLQAAIESLKQHTVTKADACELIACPKRKLYDDTLRHAIEVLRKTKDMVKSKELANLRKQFESVLKAHE